LNTSAHNLIFILIVTVLKHLNIHLVGSREAYY